MTFSFEDKGLWDEAHLAAIRPMIMKAPEEISKPLYDWLTGLARTGKGGAVMDPIEPVGVMEAGMAAMMNPGGLGRLLEIRAE